MPSSLSGQELPRDRAQQRTPPRAARSTVLLSDEIAIGVSDHDVRTRGKVGEWNANMRSDVDRIVFGRDMDGSEAIEGAGGHQSTAEYMLRGKGGGGTDGAWPRHARSEVEGVFCYHDQQHDDGAGQRQQPPPPHEYVGRRHVQPAPF